MNFKFECTTNKLGVRIWGDVISFRELYELVSKCWTTKESSRKRMCSYVGVMLSFAYDLRHTYMGDRLVQGDEPLAEDDDNRIVGFEILWPQTFFIMSSWWECLKQHNCPIEILPYIYEFTKGMEAVLKKTSRSYAAQLQPYFHGAIYAANPYIIHAFDSVTADYLNNQSLKCLVERMPCASFGTEEYNLLQEQLKSEAERLGCPVEDTKINFDFSVYNDIEL